MAPNHNRITHYIPPAHIAPIVREFIQPVPDDYFIHWLFRYRCLVCKKPGQEINEIEPRGRSKKNILNWRNRVVMCRECHTNFHKGGVTIDKIVATKMMREEFLKSIDRGAYL
jgi:hypothetical protein